MQRRFDEILSLVLEFGTSTKKNRVLLAVSGGVDSMCMADLFLHSSLEVDFALAHCNFNLRGEESDGDEDLVRQWALNNRVEFFNRSFDTVTYADSKRISIEMAARDLRYSWFAELSQEKSFDVLSVAHNANDNAETLFLNLIRGTGVKGLSGMQVSSLIPTGAGGKLIRPLLDFTRKQIEGYAFTHKLLFRDDKTNFENEYRRNKLRNIAFPVFETMNPSFIKTVAREMGYFSQIESIADDFYLKSRSKLLVEKVDGSLEVSILKLININNWSYVLYRILDEFEFNSSVISSVEELLLSEKTISGKRFFSNSHELITTSDKLIILREGLSQCNNYPLIDDFLVIRGAGKYFFKHQHINVTVKEWDESSSPIMPEGTVVLSKDVLDFPLVIRGWREGDWICPLGMKGRKKKISDVFTDLKYSLLEKRAKILLLKPRCGVEEVEEVDTQRVLSIIGERVDESVKVLPSTKEVIIISLNISDNN